MPNNESYSKGMHYWNPETKEIDTSLLEGAEVVINLAVESILGKWTEKKKAKKSALSFVKLGLESGFSFHYPKIEDVLKKCLLIKE